MSQQGLLLPGLWSGCPHRHRGKEGTTGFIGKRWKSPGKGSAFPFVVFFLPLLESHGDVEVPKGRKSAALLGFADCSPEL